MAEPSEKPYRAEYAKSGRASCKKCGESIAKDSLRLALMVQVRRGPASGQRGRGPGAGPGSLRGSLTEPPQGLLPLLPSAPPGPSLRFSAPHPFTYLFICLFIYLDFLRLAAERSPRLGARVSAGRRVRARSCSPGEPPAGGHVQRAEGSADSAGRLEGGSGQAASLVPFLLHLLFSFGLLRTFGSVTSTLWHAVGTQVFQQHRDLDFCFHLEVGSLLSIRAATKQIGLPFFFFFFIVYLGNCGRERCAGRNSINLSLACLEVPLPAQREVVLQVCSSSGEGDLPPSCAP